MEGIHESCREGRWQHQAIVEHPGVVDREVNGQRSQLLSGVLVDGILGCDAYLRLKSISKRFLNIPDEEIVEPAGTAVHADLDGVDVALTPGAGDGWMTGGILAECNGFAQRGSGHVSIEASRVLNGDESKTIFVVPVAVD